MPACVRRSPLLLEWRIQPADRSVSLPPIVDGYLGPSRHRDSAHAAAFAVEIDDGPAAIALLDVLEGQAGHFLAAQAAAQHEYQDHAIVLPFKVDGSGALINCSACSFGKPIPCPDT